MKTYVSMIPTNQVNYETGEEGRMVWIRTPDGKLMWRRLRTILDRSEATSIPTELLEDLKFGYRDYIDNLSPGMRSYVFNSVDAKEYADYMNGEREVLTPQCLRALYTKDVEWSEDLECRCCEALLYLNAYRLAKARVNAQPKPVLVSEYEQLLVENQMLRRTVEILDNALVKLAQKKDDYELKIEGMRLQLQAAEAGVKNLIEFA